jgi:hypothetical protein
VSQFKRVFTSNRNKSHNFQKLRLSGISHIVCRKLSNVSADTAVAILRVNT